MLIAIPLPVINPITGQEEDETIGIISIGFDSVQKITECKETGNAVIQYHSGKIQKTLVPFITIFIELNNTNPLMCLSMDKSKKISKAFNNMCKNNNL